MKVNFATERGQALILIVLAIVGLFGMTGLTVDGGRVYADRRHAQNAADTAVLAAGRAIIRNEQPWKATGFNMANQNGYDSNGTTNKVWVLACNETGSNCGQYAGNAEYIEVQIESHVKTTFANIILIPEMVNYVHAVARVIPGSVEPLYDGNSIVGLAPNVCKAVTYQGNANAELIGGGIFVNSDCVDSAFFNHSASAQLTAPSLCSVGGIQYVEGAINIPSTATGCEARPYPDPKYNLPNIENNCAAPAVQQGNTLKPGNVAAGQFPPSGVTNLESGIFCVNGTFKMTNSDTLIGNDVLLYMKSGDIDWEGGTIKLHAPTEGPYTGLLIYVPYSNQATIKINGNSSSEFYGTILAPASDIQINGTGGVDGLHSQIIGYTVDISGTSAMKLTYNDTEQWHTTISPSLELIK